VLRAIGLDSTWRERIYDALSEEIDLRTRILPGKASRRPSLLPDR